MTVFNTIFQACCAQAAALFPDQIGDSSDVAKLCMTLTPITLDNHRVNGAFDFEQVVPVLPAWWINGLVFVIVTFLTCLLGLISISIFLDISMRSPTNILLTVITVLDILTCLFQAPVNIHAYLMGRYKELPSYSWCTVYNYVHNFLPSSFHSTAFLLNQYLSVQRCVGVKDIKRFQAVGTYKGTVIAIILCSFVAFAINSMYPITIGIEEITVISKKVLSPTGFDFVQSCKIAPRYLHKYDVLFSSYLWLRVSILQVFPAIILCVCNTALIQASYQTHTYRKRLIGTVGIIDESNPSIATVNKHDIKSNASSISLKSGISVAPKGDNNECTINTTAHRNRTVIPHTDMVGLLEVDGRSNGISVISCSTDMIRERTGRFMNQNKYENRNIVINSNCKVTPLQRHGTVIPITPLTVDRVNGKHTINNRIKENDMESIFSAFRVTANIHQNNCSKEMVCKNEATYSENSFRNGNLREGKFHCGSDNKQRRNVLDKVKNEQNTSARERDTTRDIRKVKHLKREQNSPMNDLSKFNIIPNQTEEDRIKTVCENSPLEYSNVDSSLESDNVSSSLECGKQWNVSNKISPFVGCLPHVSTKLNGSNNFIPGNNHKLCGYNKRKQYPFNKFGGSRAEIRSSLMLVLVTSSTLVAEIFVIILLIFSFTNNILMHNEQFLSDEDLSTLIMISNMLMQLTFPLNFIFFCGLSQAFRSSLKVKLNAIMKIFTRKSATN